MPDVLAANNTEEPDQEPVSVGPVVLVLVDGWGIAPPGEGNVITVSDTPVISRLIKEYPVAALETGVLDWNTRYLSIGSGTQAVRDDEGPLATLSAAVSRTGRRQLKISDSERYAAATYFFNGLTEDKAPGELWQIISEKGGRVDKVTADFRAVLKAGLQAINSPETVDLIVLSISYLDLVALAGAGKPKVVSQAVQAIDKGLKSLQLAVANKGGILLISSAGGNAEQLLNLRTDEIDKNLTTNPVPLIIIGEDYKGLSIGGKDAPDSDLSVLAPIGTLADIAPTILALLGIEIPPGMTGRNLLD